MKLSPLTLALLATAGVAAAADPSAIVLQLTDTASSLSADGSITTNGTQNLSNQAVGETGVSLSTTISGGTQWTRAYGITAWNNDSAIATMNTDLGKTITGGQLLSTGYSSTGAGGRTLTRAVFTFSESTGYAADQKVVCYITYAGLDETPTGITVGGMGAGATITYATAGSDTGFVSSYSNVGAGNMVIARVEGTMTGNALTFNMTNGSKAGLGAFAIAPVSTLTATAVPTTVTTGTIDAPGTLTLDIGDVNSLEGVTELNLTLSSEDDWAAITEGKDLGGYVQLALVGTGGTALTYDPAALTVSIHGYTGVPGQPGKYLLGYVPEPTTATLSLLAFAGMAARRRRK